MNTNPLMPGGVEQKNQGRARVKIAVFFVLAVHVVVLGALLMQGCKREEEKQPIETTASPVIEPTNSPPLLPSSIVPPIVAPSNTPPVETHIEVPAAALTEYSVVKGDSFYTIAKKLHTTIKAIQGANPGIEPTKLQLGQKIKIPAPSEAVSAASAPTTPADTSVIIHEVKSGDTIWGLSRKYGIKESTLRAANDLKVGSTLKVGQKLKIPASGSPAPPADATPVVPPPAPAGTTPIR